MKKFLSGLLTVITLCSVLCIQNEGYAYEFKDYNQIPQDAFDQLDPPFNYRHNFSMLQECLYPENWETYHDRLNTDYMKTVGQMLTAFSFTGLGIGEITYNSFEYQRIKEAVGWDFEAAVSIYKKDEINDLFNVYFGTNVDLLELPNLYDGSDFCKTQIYGDYFIFFLPNNGYINYDCIDAQWRCGDVMGDAALWVWAMADVNYNQIISDDIYTITQTETVHGYSIPAIKYISFTPPSQENIESYISVEEDICNSYIDIIEGYDHYTESNTGNIGYFIYDIDKNGIPELIINDQTLPSASDIYIYTYRNSDAVYVGMHPGGRIKFYTYPENGFAVSYTMDGVGFMQLISVLDNQLHVTKEWDVWGFNESELLPDDSEILIGSGWTENKFTIDYEYIRNAVCSQFDLENLKEDRIKVLLNDNEIEFDQPPIIKDDRTLVPMRAIFEAMGCEVEWDDGVIDVWKDDKNIMTLWINDTEMWLPDGSIILDVPPQIVNDRTLVPVRAISESMGATVDWDGSTQSVIITR